MSTPAEEVIVANVRQYVREPVNLALLLIIPPLFIIAMSGALSTFSEVLGGNLGERAGAAVAGLWAAAVLTGVASFFLSLASARVDGRLVLAGLRRGAIGIAHGFVTVVVAALTTLVSLAILLATQEVGEPEVLSAAIFVAALIYGALGSLLSVYIHGDLEGSFVIILVFMLDAFVGGPLASGSGLLVEAFPVHFPSRIAVSAMLDTPVEPGWWVWSGIYLIALSVPAVYALINRKAVQ